jgi:hypothetical protein
MTRTAHNDGGPAFAGVTKKVAHGGPHGDKEQVTYNEGMTLRDWFAGQIAAAMTGGFCAASKSLGPEDAKVVAGASYVLADELLAERSK